MIVQLIIQTVIWFSAMGGLLFSRQEPSPGQAPGPGSS